MRHGLADAAQADDAERLAVQLATDESLAVPLPGSQRALGAPGTLRASASRIANVCSVAEIRFAVGALTTRIPSVAVAMSTLSTPIPALPTTLSFRPCVELPP